MTKFELHEMYTGFLETMFFATCYDYNNEYYLDRDFQFSDLSKSSCELINRDCIKFFEFLSPRLKDSLDPHLIGMDFFYVRNGCGVGFKDRGYVPFVADTLTLMVKQFDELRIEVGGDGQIHVQ